MRLEKGNKMKEEYQKESYCIFYGWLILAALALLIYAVLEDMHSFSDSAVHIGVICFVLLDLLFCLILIKDSIYWMAGISYETAKNAGRAKRRKWELIHFVLFLTATAAYLYYCYGQHVVRMSGSIIDSMAAAALICAAGYLSGMLCGEIRNEHSR